MQDNLSQELLVKYVHGAKVRTVKKYRGVELDNCRHQCISNEVLLLKKYNHQDN